MSLKSINVFVLLLKLLKVKQLQTTPTLVMNGYKLPDNYKIEDLKYFTEFKI